MPLLKARNAAAHTGLPALSDDSGIEVDALNGEPGIHSARYAGNDESNIQRLLRELDGVPDRKAHSPLPVCNGIPQARQ